jgi:hypothetical protein
MPTDLEIALYLQQLYDGVQGVFTYQDTIDDFSFAVLVLPDCVIVCHEGTHDAPDVENDFEAEIISPIAPMGDVHAGFWQGLTAAYAKILPYLPKDKPIVLCGHSLGSGRVNLATGYLIYKGYSPENLTRVKFASPRSNDIKWELSLTGSPLRSYWNYRSEFLLGHDPVCDVPVECDVLGLPYYTKEPKIIICCPPSLCDAWGPSIGWHHLFLYTQALEELKNG